MALRGMRASGASSGVTRALGDNLRVGNGLAAVDPTGGLGGSRAAPSPAVTPYPGSGWPCARARLPAALSSRPQAMGTSETWSQAKGPGKAGSQASSRPRARPRAPFAVAEAGGGTASKASGGSPTIPRDAKPLGDIPNTTIWPCFCGTLTVSVVCRRILAGKSPPGQWRRRPRIAPGSSRDRGTGSSRGARGSRQARPGRPPP